MVRDANWFYENINIFETGNVPSLYTSYALPQDKDYESREDWEAWRIRYIDPRSGTDTLIRGQYEKLLNVVSNIADLLQGFFDASGTYAKQYQRSLSTGDEDLTYNAYENYYEEFQDTLEEIIPLYEMLPNFLRQDRQLLWLINMQDDDIEMSYNENTFVPPHLHINDIIPILSDLREIESKLKEKWIGMMRVYEKYALMEYPNG